MTGIKVTLVGLVPVTGRKRGRVVSDGLRLPVWYLYDCETVRY